jgi:hypothetical protein
MVCMVAIVALPAFAHAAAFSAEYPAPGTTVHGQPAVVSVDVAGAVLNTKTGVITVNGVAYKAYVTQGAAGSWSASESLVGGVYKTTWTWNSGVGVATMAVYPSALATGGPYTVTATVKDTTGTVLTDPTTWTFSVAATPTPVIPPVVTAANQTCRTVGCHGTQYDNDNAMGPICSSCHIDKFGAHGFDMNASGHNTTLEGVIGAKELFDGTEGVTLHTVDATPAPDPNAGKVATLTTEWQFPTHAVFWGDPGTAGHVDSVAKAWVDSWNASNAATQTTYKSLDKDSVVTCEDCHTGLTAAGPHGAAQNFGIDPAYPGDYNEAELTKWIVTNPSGIKVRAVDSYFQVSAATGLISDCPSDTTKVGTAGWYSGEPTKLTTMSVTTAAGSYVTKVNADGQNHAIICSKCHELEVSGDGYMSERTPQAEPWMGDGTNGTTLGQPTFTNTGHVNSAHIGGSNVAHGNRHQDTVGGDSQCVDCHIAIPHGWKRPRLLVNSGPNPVSVAGGVSSTFDKVQDVYPYVSAHQHGGLDDGAASPVAPGSLQSFWGAYPTLNSAPRGMQSLSGDEEHELVTDWGTNIFGQTWVAPADEGNLSGPYTLHVNSVPPHGNIAGGLPITAKSNYCTNAQGYQGAAAGSGAALKPSAIAGYSLINVTLQSGTAGADGSVYTATLASTPTKNQNYVEWKEYQCEGCNDHKAAQETWMGIGATGTSTAVNLGNYTNTVRVKE